MKRFISILLTVILLFTCVLVGPSMVYASPKSETSRAIAIVFDNSGSMYDAGDQAWCRATYAMEVFASMLNAGDTLQIYPMHPITVGGKEYTMQNPFQITDAAQATSIRDIFTNDAGGTPIESIPLMFYCTLPNSGRYISEITAMVDAVIDVFREEYSKWEKEEDVKFVLCTRLTDELTLLKRNYQFYVEHLRAPAATENPVIDIIQRKIRDVILSAPEPEDYEALLDKVAKEFKDSENS